MNDLISDVGGEFKGELGEFVEAHGIRQYFTRCGNGLIERNGGIGKAAARKAIRDVGARSFVEVQRLASMVNWAKKARIKPSGHSLMCHWSQDSSCRGRFWMKSRVANWHHWKFQMTHPSSVDGCHGCGPRDVPSKTIDQSRFETRAGWCSSERSHKSWDKQIGLCLAESQENRTEARTALVHHRWYGLQPPWWGIEEQRVRVSSRDA